jgi:hypothetical protein
MRSMADLRVETLRELCAPLTRLPLPRTVCLPTNFPYSHFNHFTDSVYHAYNHKVLIIDQPLLRVSPPTGRIYRDNRPNMPEEPSQYFPRETARCWLGSIIRSLTAYNERLFLSALSCLHHQTEEALCSRLSPRYDSLCPHDSLLCHSALLRYCRFPRHRCLPRHVRTFRSVSRLVSRHPWLDTALVPMSLIHNVQLSPLHGFAIFY